MNFTPPSKRILIIEDDECILDALRELLTDEGYEVITAPQGQKGLDLLRATDPLPGLILLDLMMPVMDGVMFRQAQAADPRLAGVPVVLMSAGQDLEARRTEVGAGHCMKKPLNLEEVLEIVARFCK